MSRQRGARWPVNGGKYVIKREAIDGDSLRRLQGHTAGYQARFEKLREAGRNSDGDGGVIIFNDGGAGGLDGDRARATFDEAPPPCIEQLVRDFCGGDGRRFWLGNTARLATMPGGGDQIAHYDRAQNVSELAGHLAASGNMVDKPGAYGAEGGPAPKGWREQARRLFRGGGHQPDGAPFQYIVAVGARQLKVFNAAGVGSLLDLNPGDALFFAGDLHHAGAGRAPFGAACFGYVDGASCCRARGATVLYPTSPYPTSPTSQSKRRRVDGGNPAAGGETATTTTGPQGPGAQQLVGKRAAPLAGLSKVKAEIAAATSASEPPGAAAPAVPQEPGPAPEAAPRPPPRDAPGGPDYQQPSATGGRFTGAAGPAPPPAAGPATPPAAGPATPAAAQALLLLNSRGQPPACPPAAQPAWVHGARPLVKRGMYPRVCPRPGCGATKASFTGQWSQHFAKKNMEGGSHGAATLCGAYLRDTWLPANPHAAKQ